MIWNWPEPSVTADRVFSMSAGLDTSTVTPGSTAPEVSLDDTGDRGLLGKRCGWQQGQTQECAREHG